MKNNNYLITAALLYANGPVHIGHLAGAYLPADVYSKFLRLKKEKVLFVCGSDEHGAAITLQSKKENKTPKEIVDYYHNKNKSSFKNIGVDFDIFDRTSEKHHHNLSSEYFTQLNNDKYFFKKKSNQFFDKDYNQFLADRYIKGECPKCGYLEAYGDQCEQCGSSLNPNDLKNPRSTLSGKEPVVKETEHWYLPMQNHEEWLKEWLTKGKLQGKEKHDVSKWRKQVLSQCKSWLDGGLKPRAMTRDLDWGVKVPLDNYKNKVLYVWLDAPIGYVSATKKYCLENNLEWTDFWKSDNSKIINFIGKDNIVFHCIIFPIILKCLKDFCLPHNVIANEFLNLEGNKISTSRNWAVWLDDYLRDFPEQQDALRYVLCITAPESKDNDFTWKEFQSRNNNELVAILGNFVNRVFVLIHKYWDGKIPDNIVYKDSDKLFLKKTESIKLNIDLKLQSFKFKEALSEVMNMARLGNKFLADNEPWKLIKEDEERTRTILFISVNMIREISILISPFLPFTSIKLQKMLNLGRKMFWEDLDLNFNSNHILNKPELLFRTIDDKEIELQIEKLEKN